MRSVSAWLVVALPIAAWSAAELSVLGGDDSLSLLQTRMARKNSDPASGATYDMDDIDDIALDASADIKHTAVVSQKVSRAIDTMNFAVAKLFALETGVEDEAVSSSSSELVIDRMVQDIKEKVDVTADGIKNKLQASTEAAEAIRTMSEAMSQFDVAGSAESVGKADTIERLADSRTLLSVPIQKPSSKTGDNKVGKHHRAAGASAVKDLVQRADKIADTLKEVTEAKESIVSKHPGEIDSASANTLEVLDETVWKIRAEADKIAAKLKDAAELEDNSEDNAKLKAGKHMQHMNAGNAHSSSRNTKLGAVRHSWSKSLDDMAGTSDEARQHSNKQVVATSSDNKADAKDEEQTGSGATGAKSLHDVTTADVKDEEQTGSGATRAKPLHDAVAKDEEIGTGARSLHDVTTQSSAATGRRSAEHGGRRLESDKSFHHDERSDEVGSKMSNAATAHSHSVISVKMERLEDDPDDSDDHLCYPGRVINFGAAKLIHSNLGGAGPDTGDETLVYQGVAAVDGAEVNLVVAALSAYTPYNAKKNGLAGTFGQINLQVETKVDLSFRLVYNSGGDDAPMDSFYFSFVDLDQGSAPSAAEKITVKGFESYRLSEETEVLFKARGEDAATFSSSWRGGKLDNPSNPLSMNKLERDRTVTAVFRNTSSFEVTFEEIGYANEVQGRNFLFAGVSDLVCSKEQKCAMYECPEGFHLRQRAEFLVCEGRRCTEKDRGLCCFAAASS